MTLQSVMEYYKLFSTNSLLLEIILFNFL